MNTAFIGILVKETLHMFRDVQSLIMVLLMPLLMLFLYGYAVSLDMREIDIALIDQSHSPESRALLDRVSSTEFFRVVARDIPERSVEVLLQSRSIHCALVIPPDYARRLVDGREAQVQLIIDASDPNAAAFINSYLGQIVGSQGAPGSMAREGRFSVSPRIFYNPEMRSANYYVPGLIALILGLITTVLTCISIVREKETGTMEQILVSPITPRQLILGKIAPYVAIGFLDGALILLTGSLVFNVPIKGSLILVLAMMLLYIVTGLSLGVLISTRVKTQSDALLRGNALTNLPTMMLSGFIFPISSMPRILQFVSAAVPATYFIQIIRGIVLKGNTLSNLWPQAVVLLGMDILLIGLSIRSFRIRLE